MLMVICAVKNMFDKAYGIMYYRIELKYNLTFREV